MLFKPALRTLLTQKEDQKQRQKIDEDEEEFYEDEDEKIEFNVGGVEQTKTEEKKFEYFYNPKEIRPQEAGADTTCFWELSLMREFYHPSVVKFSDLIMQNAKKLNYDGNPLQDFSLTSFLDKFNYKTPKVKRSSYVKNKQNILLLEKPMVNSKEFVDTPLELVREDEKFYHKYMKERQAKKEKEAAISSQFDLKNEIVNLKKRKLDEISSLHDEV
jgi:ribosome biogenesis protein MAK21